MVVAGRLLPNFQLSGKRNDLDQNHTCSVAHRREDPERGEPRREDGPRTTFLQWLIAAWILIEESHRGRTACARPSFSGSSQRGSDRGESRGVRSNTLTLGLEQVASIIVSGRV